MAPNNKNSNQTKQIHNSDDSLENTVRLLAALTRKDIEKTYNISNAHGTETYYSNRYGWSLRKTVS